MRYPLTLLLLLVFLASAQSQTTVAGDSTGRGEQQKNLNTSSQKVVKSYNDNKSREEIAEDYFNLAIELAGQGTYDKAETFLIKAIELVRNSKKKNSRLSAYYRELARVQELQNKKNDAALNYDKASVASEDKSQRQINANDAQRMRNPNNPELELDYLNQNVQIQSSASDNKSRGQTYKQMAEVNRAMNNNDVALTNYNNALVDVGNNSPEAIPIKNSMATLLAESNKFDEAIIIQQEVVAQSQQFAPVNVQAQQMRQLSDMYFKNNSFSEGLRLLQEAYTLAKEKGSVKEAKTSLDSLVKFYENTHQDVQVLNMYRDFVQNVEGIIARDSSLVDIKLFEITEQKLTQLEAERNLKDELILRKNRNNLMLIGFVAILIILLFLLVRGWFSIRRNNKRIALQSLRREMNPHFIFNSLNSVNQFIASNNDIEANKYLTAYSNLMRRVMENSNNDYVTLTQETEQLSKYLELEKLRFPSTFDYSLTVDPLLDTDFVKVPNMLIQPHIENAIWHGLRYKESKGRLDVRFVKENKQTAVIIEDDGIGITESRKLKTRHQKMHDSRGLKNVEERIRLLNDLYNTHISCNITEKNGSSSGVVVKIIW